ncbi:MAG: ABC transporter substrate-binding protein [Burkholderiaceae bacterium]
MKPRRTLLFGVAAALAGVGRPLHARSDAVPVRIGVLAPSTRANEAITLKPFFDQMRELGWVEGRNVVYDHAYADDLRGNLDPLAGQLVARSPDIIFAPPSPAAVAARRATRRIPIVFATGTDPVGTGLVESLARPGGNVTGVLSVIDSLAPKLVEIIRAVLPAVRRLGYLSDPADPRSRTDLAALGPPLAAWNMTIVVADVVEPGALNRALGTLIERRVEAILTGTSLTFNLRRQVIERSHAAGIPVFGHRAEFAEAGALVAYGAPLPQQMRRAAELVDKILNGARPADIPVEQPSVFEMVVNLKTARALGITLAPAVLLRADRVIE